MAKERLKIGSALVGTAAVVLGIGSLVLQNVDPETQREKVFLEFPTRAEYELSRDDLLDQWVATGRLRSIVELELFFKILKHEDVARRRKVVYPGVPNRRDVATKYRSRRDEDGKPVVVFE